MHEYADQNPTKKLLAEYETKITEFHKSITNARIDWQYGQMLDLRSLQQ
jgi:hypothetical protein